LVPRSANDLDAKRHQVAYAEALTHQFEGFTLEGVKATSNQDAQRTVADFVSRFVRAGDSALKSKVVAKAYRRNWFDKDCRRAIDARRSAYQAMLRDIHNESLVSIWKQKRKEARDIVKNKKKAGFEKFIDGVSEASRSDSKTFWKGVKRLIPSSGKSTVLPSIRKADGTLASSEEENSEAWAAYREELGLPQDSNHFDKNFYAHVVQEVKDLERKSHGETSILDRPFNMSELSKALSKAKPWKAAGKDGSRNEYFKYGGNPAKLALLQLFNWLRVNELFPQDWSVAVLIQLFKDGDESDPDNYRGIALISCLGKLYLSMIAERVSTHMEGLLSKNQAGFRKHRGTTEQILTLREVLVRRYRGSKSTYLFFVDFKKAFDRVWHDGLWKIMHAAGITGKAWRIIKEVYRDVKMSVLVNGKTSREVQSYVGVRQGCPLSPILFNIFVDVLAKELEQGGLAGGGAGNSDCKGPLRIGGITLAELLYADDLVVAAETPQELQRLINVVEAFSSKWRLDVNLSKSKVMVIHPPRQTRSLELHSWKFRGEEIEVVSKYKYLGVVFSSNMSWAPHISYITTKARAKHARSKRFLANKQLPFKARKLVWDSLVKSSLSYANEVWVPNSKEYKKLESLQTQAGVTMLKLNMHTSVEAVRRLMGAFSLKTTALSSRLKYYGKILQMEPDTWPQILRAQREVKPSFSGKTYISWFKRTRDLIESSDILKEAAKDLRQAEMNLYVGQINPDEPDSLVKKAQLARGAWTSAIDRWCLEIEKINLETSARGTRCFSTDSCLLNTVRLHLQSCSNRLTMETRLEFVF
jgi:hypothetical protein